MYKTNVIIGMQWGDEGKGKITDYLAQDSDVVVRYQGGNNAGHSIEFNNKKFALNHIPSGIFNPKIKNIMAQGMVINPKMLLNEISELKKNGIKDFQLFISDRAHVILPYHLDIDSKLEEIKKGIDPSKMIGTTKKGIGPAYEDKFSRIGIRFCDFINEKKFKDSLSNTLVIKNKILKAFDLEEYLVETIFEEYKSYAKQLKSFVVDTGVMLEEQINKSKKVIFEGAQGVMLCVENGNYPFVTSSSPTASAVPLGTGLNNTHINSVIGIVKAYSTKVGTGALPTSLEIVNPKLASEIREKGREYGTVTGRPRKIGWLDAVALRHAKRVAGTTELTITLLDVLDDLEEINIANKYILDGKEIDFVPSSDDLYEQCKPVYIKVKGWKKDITQIKNYKELPKEAKDYLKKIEELIGLPITRFSVGPDRKQTIEIKKGSND